MAYIAWLPGIVLEMIVHGALRKLLPTATRKDTTVENREREADHEQRLQKQVSARSTPSTPVCMTVPEPGRLAGVRVPELPRLVTFWSVYMPAEGVDASRTTQADIDCMVVTGRSNFLPDVKNYFQGNVTWLMKRCELRLLDNPASGYVGAPTAHFNRRGKHHGSATASSLQDGQLLATLAR